MEIKQKVIGISTEYQILSKSTAFLGIIKDKDGKISQMEAAEKTDLGPMAPLDYYEGPGFL